MKKLIIYLLFVGILLSACNSNNIEAETKSDKIPDNLKTLIQQLHVEDSKLTGKTPAAETSDINASCHKLLLSIINSYDSVILPADLIVSNDSNMYLKITKDTNIGGKKARIIQYGKKKADEGSSTKVYIQEFDKKNVKNTEVLSAATNCVQFARVFIADIYEFSGTYYSVIGNEFFNTNDSNYYLNLIVLKYSQNKWEQVEIGGSKVMPQLQPGCSLTVEKTNSAISINVKDEKGKSVQSILDFSEGKPILKLSAGQLTKSNNNINKVNPIVCGYIIGSYVSGKWLDIFNTFEQISGHETYKIYSMMEYIGDGKGLSKEAVTEDVQGALPRVTISNADDTFEAYDLSSPSMVYSENFSKRIAIGADLNALPRIPQKLSNDTDIYKNVVSDIIRKQGFETQDVNIRQTLKIDLEGDGVDEVLLTASNVNIPSITEGKKTYSVVILRKLINGKVENIIIREDYYINGKSTHGYGATALYVPFILDCNGDGIMELLVEGTFAPGSFMDIYEIKGSNVTKVLTNGVSA